MSNCLDQPCINCDQIDCADACLDPVYSNCVFYNGDQITTSVVNIMPNDTLTTVIGKLAQNASDVAVGLNFNPTTNSLCLTKNGSTVICKTLNSYNTEYLVLTVGKHLQLWAPGSPAVLISDIDLTTILNSPTALVMTSPNLSVVQTGSGGYDVVITVVPSSDLGNQFTLGSDGKPYVPPPPQALSDVSIPNIEGLLWTKTYSNGRVTLTPSFDWNYIASQVCPICDAGAPVPSDLIVQPL